MKLSKDKWIHLVNPDSKQINDAALLTKIESKSIKTILDEEELSRVKVNKDHKLIIANFPFKLGKTNQYTTIPLGIIISSSGYVVTISVKENPYMEQLQNLVDHEVSSEKFLLSLFILIALDYQRVLVSISDDLDKLENNLSEATSNKEIIDILSLEKSLVYFSNALRHNKLVLEKIQSSNSIKDEEILTDAILETNQGVEMTNLYKDVLNSTRETFSSIINNNQNKIMKLLAAITIIFSVPTMIFSFFGMNVHFGEYMDKPTTFFIILILSGILALLVAKILKDKELL